MQNITKKRSIQCDYSKVRIFPYKKKPQGAKIQVGQEYDSRGILSGHPLFCTVAVTLVAFEQLKCD